MAPKEAREFTYERGRFNQGSGQHLLFSYHHLDVLLNTYCSLITGL